MAIYLSRKKGGTVATPITPSNISPAQMTANVAVNPTANGYAIESYSSVTPSNSSPVALASGEIDKIGGNGYAISSMEDVIPHNDYPVTLYENHIYRIIFEDGVLIKELFSKTPSDVNPAVIVSGGIFKSTGNGYLYATQQTTPTSITPSNSSPVALTANTPVKPTASGYAISSYSSKTPSDSSPASVSSGAIIKASASGYLYSSSGLGKCKAGSFTWASSGTTKVTVGFKPKQLTIINTTSLTTRNICYDERQSTTKFVMSTSSSSLTSYNIGDTNGWRIKSIDSDGFTMTAGNNNSMIYFAIG